MENNYRYYTGLRIYIKKFLLLIGLSLFTITSFSSEDSKNCVNCFETEIISIDKSDDCLNIQLEISAFNCIHALSHFSAEVPCGTVTEASNSKGWPMELNSTDPTTGITGIKVDDIKNFGESSDSTSFILSYTICSSDAECIKLIENRDFIVAYKAATCVFIDTIEVSNSHLEASITPGHIDCYDEASGKVETQILNGTPPYSYQWNTGETSAHLLNIKAGTYQVLITDANGSTLQLSAEVTQTNAINVESKITHSNCGLNDGAIETLVTGGTAPYHYSWDNGDTISTLSKLEAGLYTLILSDANQCTKTLKFNIQNITSLTASVTTDVIACHEEGEGELSVTPSGGTEPYTYLWDNGDTTAIANNLNGGTHKVIITDALGCSIEKRAYVILQKLTASASINNPVCNSDVTGSVELDISNGTEPYSILWNTGDTTSYLNDLAGGWYWADISDALGCTYRKYVNIKAPQEIALNASYRRLSCLESDSSILVDLNASGGTAPYKFYYDDEEITGTYTVDKVAYYTFRVVDNNGCETIDSIYIERPNANLNSSISIVQTDCDQPDYGSASIIINGGNAPYLVSWSDGSEQMERSDLMPGNYNVAVSDASGCSAEHQFTINAIELASAEILHPDALPDCLSPDQSLIAMLNNASSYEWDIIDDTNTWIIQEAGMEELIYTSGPGTAIITLKAISKDGCMAIDSLALTCQQDDTEEPIDPNPDPEDDCTPCYQIVPTGIWNLEDNCYKYSATVLTDGSCRFELSHLSFEVMNGSIQYLNNSKGWKTEINSKDPTSGLYGFKIDDIQNFGKTKDQFNIEFAICFQGDRQDEFTLAYKSAQCLAIDTLIFSRELYSNQLVSKSYPNPFTDKINIDFTAKEDTNAELYIYDVYGNLIECLYKGKVTTNTYYNFEFTAKDTKENIFFYRLVCGQEISQGKIIKLR